VVEKKGTKAVAEAYLKYLYSPEGQEIAAKTSIAHAIRLSRRNTKTNSRN
jgi:ABC-type sulfate transport system substrate-binding protein